MLTAKSIMHLIAFRRQTDSSKLRPVNKIGDDTLSERVQYVSPKKIKNSVKSNMMYLLRYETLEGDLEVIGVPGSVLKHLLIQDSNTHFYAHVNYVGDKLVLSYNSGKSTLPIQLEINSPSNYNRL